MQTPNNRAGRLTEKVMAEVRRCAPKMSTHQFNQIWNGVYKQLSEEFPEGTPLTEPRFLPPDITTRVIQESELDHLRRLDT